MPNALAHTLFAAIVAIAFASLISAPFEHKLVAGVIVIGASFLPDLDHENATARKYYRKVMPVVAAIFAYFMASAVLGLSWLPSLLIAIVAAFPLSALSEILIPPHRGIMHTFLFAGAACVGIYALLSFAGIGQALLFALAAFIGYASHLVLDGSIK